MPAQTIPAGSTLVTIPGGFGTVPQQLTLATSWFTQSAQVAQSPTVTTVAFSVPAPPGGGLLYWNQMGGNQPTTSNPPPVSAVLSIPAGDVSATVFGAFPDNYQVAVTLSWFSDWTLEAMIPPGSQDACEFTVLFAVPAPPGGGTMYYTIIPEAPVTESGQVSTLQDYLDELRRLLHDPQDQYWTVTDKVSNLNRALQRRDVDTGANRVLVPFALTIGKDTYSFNELGRFPARPFAPILTTFGNSVSDWFTASRVVCERSGNFTVEFAVPAPPPDGGVLQWTVPLTAATGTVSPTGGVAVAVPAGAITVDVPAPQPPRIFDVVGINLVYIAQRVVLLSMSYTKLNVLKRPWVPYQGIPEAWARYGTSQVIIGPQPSLNYLTEFDVCVYADPLVALTDIDPVPYPYTLRLVPTYAAYLCKQNERQYDEAQTFLQDYMRELDVARNARVGLLPSAYGRVGSY
jgi:hypothetical protein